MPKFLTLLAVLLASSASAHPYRVHSPRELHAARHCSNHHPRACIRRAALHWRVSYRTGVCIASHETGPDDCFHVDPSLCNTEGSGACGLFQFMPSTYASTPYDETCGSLFRAKCSALAWAYLWSRGQHYHWRGAY